MISRELVMGMVVAVANLGCSPSSETDYSTSADVMPAAVLPLDSDDRSPDLPAAVTAQREVSTAAKVGSLREVARIDGMAEDLVPIGLLASRHDGAIAVTQPQDRQVRIYGASGRLIETFGRSGGGPGEFEGLSRLGWVGDTLWVADAIQRRLTFVAPGPELLRTLPMAATGTLGVTSNGSLIVRGSAPGDSLSFDRFNGEGTMKEAHLALLPPGDHTQIRFPGGTVSIPFGSRPHFAVSPNSELLALVEVFVEGSEAENFTLSVLSSEGSTLFTKRFPFQGERIPEDVWRSTIETRAGIFGPTPGGDVLRSQARKPTFFPPIRSILVGDDGTTWIELRHEAEGAPYLVVDRSGDVVGSFVLAESNRLGAVPSVSEVWVVEPNELDVEDIVKYRIIW